ncbi:FAD-dependent oxidoreductase [Williamsia serinedens]|uniref:NADH dehydrogenase, FAD-containing subunit n=1 Tax=Williamsia serinedens TaxID=391736 RepID=A0ABT1GWT5_9NOCA|nr:FAD-dependent oxidoreductase [Williamsia serinedens]MCP2159452.1 NADH dehydrogenase, FAD-containing subunit [Williamsia serinedens]
MTRPTVLVAGMGDVGTLTAMHLARHVDVVGVATTPGLVSGQELGLRLSDPDRWSQDYWVDYRRYRRLDGVEIVRGRVSGVDGATQTAGIVSDRGETERRWDALVIATGVTNGFWRSPDVLDAAGVDSGLRTHHEAVRTARRVAVIGGGAAAVAAAAGVAARVPAARVDLYFPGERPLRDHHPRTWSTVQRRLEDLGVGLHPGHRAGVPPNADRAGVGPGVVEWTTGQPGVAADAIVWAIGRAVPHTGWLPETVLDEDGFVRVDPTLRVPGLPHTFAVGDVAATDPLRGSARNRADRLVAHNVRADLAGRRLRCYRPRTTRWGSVLGPQPDGLEVFTPAGIGVRIPRPVVDRVLRPWIVNRGIYGGIRPR